jgi:hypothetical protein
MPYSFARYTSAGSAGPYTVPFSYRQRSDVLVYVNGVSVPFTWPTSSTVTLNSAPVAGALVEIRRETSEDARLTQWSSINQIDADNLETMSVQSFNLAQEAIDTARDAKAKALRVADREADIGPIPSATARANRYLGFDASGNITLYQGEQLGGTIDPNTAPRASQYVVMTADATLTNERVLAVGTGLSLTDGGAGGSATIAVPNDGITNTQLNNMAQNTLKGRVSTGTGDPEDLTAAQVISLLTAADGPGSLLDADTVDGIQGSAIVQNTRQVIAGAGLEGGGSLSVDRTLGISGGGVINTMLANIPQNTIKGRISPGVGSPEDLTAGQLITMLQIADGAGSGLDADTLDGLQGSAYLAAVRQVQTGAGLTGGGDLTEDRTIAVATNGITNTLLAQVDTATIKGRFAAGTGNVQDLTPAQVVSIIHQADGPGSLLDADTLDGIQAAAFVQTTRSINTTGALTGGGSLAADLTLSISPGSVTDAMLSQVSSGIIRGRASAGSGNIENLSAAQVTALLNNMVGATAFTAGTKGLVPAAAAGEQSLFLRGDGTWQPAAGGGGGSGAPIAGKYIAYGSDTGLSDERVLAVEAGALTLTDAGVGGGNITIAVATNGITNGKLATMTAGTIKGRNTGTGSPEDLTATQVTALLNNMVGSNGTVAGTKGLVPAPGATDNTLYLRGDGTWAAPSGSGAPTTATYVTITTDATLTNERTLAAEAGVLSLTDAGAGLAATLGVAANGISNAKLRQGAALSVIGNATNATANVADIAAATDGHVLRRSGTALGFGTIATAGIGDDQVTYAKLQNMTTQRLIGRTTAAAGDPEELSVTAPLTLVAGSGTLNFDQTAAIGNNARVAVLNNGAAVGTRRGINLIPGSGVTYSIADDSANERVNVTINSSATGAPAGAAYLTLALDGTLTSERVLAAGTGISLTDGGANGNATLALNVNGLTTAASSSYLNDFVAIHSASEGGPRKLALQNIKPTEAIVVACSDENTAGITLSTSVPKVRFRMPYAFTLTDIKASLNAAQASGATLFTVDVRKSGSTIFTTQMTFDNTETTTVTAVTPRVLTANPTTFTADEEVTIFVSNNTAGNVAAGLKVTMIGSRT